MTISLTDPELPAVKIRVSIDKCKTPLVCPKACYNLCPQGVFLVAANPVKVAAKYTPVDVNTPGDYMIIAPQVPKCIGCNICVENCPISAIKIKYKPKKKESESESSD